MAKQIGWVFFILIVAFFTYAGMQPPVDSCASIESQIRQMWVAAIVPAHGDEAVRVRIAADLVKSAEQLCREFRDAKPTQLPTELQNLIK